MGSFRQVFQTDSMDCGAACLCMIARHYVVCHRVSGKGSDRVFHICDPAIGKIRVRGDELRSHWLSGHLGEEEVGLAMQLEPAPDFKEKQPEDPADGFGLLFFSRYILPHKWQLAGLLFGALVVMTMGYFLPFISQSVVDIGILGRNMDFIVLMMAMQLMMSAPKLMEQLNANIHYQIFCGTRISSANPLTNYKLIDDIILELSNRLRIQNQQEALAEAWKPYMKNLDTLYTDATCYESAMRYPTDAKLLWECIEKVYPMMCEASRELGIHRMRTKYHDVARVRATAMEGWKDPLECRRNITD